MQLKKPAFTQQFCQTFTLTVENGVLFCFLQWGGPLLTWGSVVFPSYWLFTFGYMKRKGNPLLYLSISVVLLDVHTISGKGLAMYDVRSSPIWAIAFTPKILPDLCTLNGGNGRIFVILSKKH